MSVVSVEAVSRTMEALLIRENRPVFYEDRATGAALPVSPASAAAAHGLLPALVVAGEAVWREATGSGFGLDIARDPSAMLGYRLRAIRHGTFTAVMLSTMEAAAQAVRPGMLVVNDLNALWAAAEARLEQRSTPAPRPNKGASP